MNGQPKEDYKCRTAEGILEKQMAPEQIIRLPSFVGGLPEFSCHGFIVAIAYQTRDICFHI